MAVSVADVMRHVHNFFERERLAGEFAILDGALTPAVRSPYVAIYGSKADGVYAVTEGKLDGWIGQDEAFTGIVWGLYPPKDFIDVCVAASAYDGKNPAGAYLSENFGNYSYTRAGGRNGGPAGWQEAFSATLLPYRRMWTEVRC